MLHNKDQKTLAWFAGIEGREASAKAIHRYGIFSLDGGQTSNYPKYPHYRYGIIELDNYLSGKVIRRSFGQDFWAQISQPKVPGINSRDNFLTRASKRKRVVSVSKHARTDNKHRISHFCTISIDDTPLLRSSSHCLITIMIINKQLANIVVKLVYIVINHTLCRSTNVVVSIYKVV